MLEKPVNVRFEGRFGFPSPFFLRRAQFESPVLENSLAQLMEDPDCGLFASFGRPPHLRTSNP